MHLRHVGQNARALADRIDTERAFAQPHLAGLGLEQAEQRFQQRGLAAAVRPQQRQHLARLERDIEPAPDRVVGVADGEIVAGEDHDQIFLTTMSSARSPKAR